MRLVAVVMGAASPDARAKASLELLNYGFRFFETRRLYETGKPIAAARVWKGASEKVALVVPADLWVIIPRGSMDQIQARTEAPRDLEAPVPADKPVGKLSISLAGEPLAETPLVPLAAVAEGSLWRQLVDTILLWFE
jgi:D-alanyl-D-alanine carboxypeptidase (penicillin-binding protein 5/6)